MKIGDAMPQGSRQRKPAKAGSETKPDRGSSRNLIVKEIIRGLYRGQFVPGQRLVEADLTARFRVSRGTVREALNRLAAEGVVTLNHHRGAYIRSMTRDEVIELLSVMEVIVGLAARCAAERIDVPGNRDVLKEANNRILALKNVDDFLSYIRARDAFFRALVKIGGNKQLERVFDNVHIHLIGVQFPESQPMWPNARALDYDRMTEVIRSGDPAQAEAVAKRHVRSVAQDIAALPPTAFGIVER
jgi:DNA-binding GntR family transcriptional regulator